MDDPAYPMPEPLRRRFAENLRRSQAEDRERQRQAAIRSREALGGLATKQPQQEPKDDPESLDQP